MKRACATIASTFVLGALAFAPSASASVEFGSHCTAYNGEAGLSLIGIGHGANNPLPVRAPIGGVITEWSSSIGVPFPPGAFNEVLQVYRNIGGSNYVLAAQSESRPVAPGQNSFPAQVPVEAGDFLGATGSEGGFPAGLYCETEDPGDVVAYYEAPLAVGQSAEFGTDSPYQVPMAAVIEPDADHDGYGDETQDGCPQSAALHTPCPVIVLDASTLTGKRAVTVYVATDNEGPVTVTGVAPLGKGKNATLNAGPKTVPPGKVVSFKLKFNAKLKKRLKELPPSKKLTLKITASATSAAGQVSTDKAKAKLKGQG